MNGCNEQTVLATVWYSGSTRLSDKLGSMKATPAKCCLPPAFHWSWSAFSRTSAEQNGLRISSLWDLPQGTSEDMFGPAHIPLHPPPPPQITHLASTLLPGGGAGRASAFPALKTLCLPGLATSRGCSSHWSLPTVP